jgi:hypothetical protein
MHSWARLEAYRGSMQLCRLCPQKKKKAERLKRAKADEAAIASGLEPPPRQQQRVRG